MKVTSKRPMNLFFIEIMIALLFFSISGAVILNVFASADRKSRESAALESAVICAQSIAEAYSVYADAERAVNLAMTEATSPKNLEIKTDETVTPTAAGTLSQLKIDFYDGIDLVYTFSCSAYKTKGAADE